MAINTLSANRQRTSVSRQTVQLDTSGKEVLVVEGTSRRTSAIQSRKIAIWSDVAFRMMIGGSSVAADANSPMFPAGQFLVIDWTPGDYLATFWDGSNAGTFNAIGCY
jgi:hypothetical protein